MSFTTQLGTPVSLRRAAWASAAGIATFVLTNGPKRKKLFDSVMISAFVIGFTTCIPLGLGSPEPDGDSSEA